MSCDGARDYATRIAHCHVEKIVKVAHPVRVNLLLIEDDVDVADVLVRAFREEGHRATVSYTGEAGLSRLAQERPDAVLLDAVAKNEWNRGVTTDSFDRSGPAGHHYYRPRYEERDHGGAGTRGNGSDREVLCSEEFQRVIGSSREQALPALSGQIQLVPSVDLSLPHHMKSLVEEFLCMRDGFRIASAARTPAEHLQPCRETTDDRREIGDFGVNEHQGKEGQSPQGDDVGRPQARRDSLDERRRSGLFFLRAPPVGSDTNEGHAVAQPLSLLDLHVDQTAEARALYRPSATFGRRPDVRTLADTNV